MGAKVTLESVLPLLFAQLVEYLPLLAAWLDIKKAVNDRLFIVINPRRDYFLPLKFSIDC